jgi:cysteinyl-tRNA synthetase
MTIRFFILQAHYRSTIDFSNDALKAAEKGLERLLTAIKTLDELEISAETTVDISGLKEKCFSAMNDDLNSPITIASLFDGVKIINLIKAGAERISACELSDLKTFFKTMVFDILGFKDEKTGKSDNNGVLEGTIDLLLKLRVEAKNNKDWGTADKIRNELNALGVEIKDTKDGFEWSLK